MLALPTPTLPPATTTNSLIVGRDRLFIVDPGSPEPEDQERLFDELEEMQAAGAVLDSILCTHHHRDHVGAVAALSRRFHLPVRAHPITAPRLPTGCRPGDAIGDGDRIDLGRAPDGSGDWHLEAMFTPGHDRGHLVFRESRYGALLAGDMVSTVATIMIDPPEGHMRTYMESLERLSTTEISTLYPAHGPAVPDGGAVIRKFIAHRQRRHQGLQDALAQGPNTVEGLLPTVYWDVDERMYPYAARSLLAGLEMLEEEGRAVRDGERWTAICRP
jgi:glyoxylase-like metal-dependent hydrolase (beta-lactamase superfamily II)